MAKSVKLADIAEIVGVSTVTVSKALSDQKGVGEELRKQIKKIASEMGYVSPSVAKSQDEKKSYNIGVIVSECYFDQTQSFYWLMYQELATRALSKNSFTMLEVISCEDEANCVVPKLLDGKRVNGIVVIGAMRRNYLDVVEEKSSVPIVYLDFYSKEQECDSVISNGYGGMYKLTDYLCSLGHRKIGYVGTLYATNSITDRYFGYYKALLEYGVEPQKKYLIEDRDLNTSEVKKIDDALPVDGDMPTAYVCNCDLIALELISALNKKGYRVPEDVSVVGFDDYAFPNANNIRLTTYSVDVKEMAKKVIKILVKRMDGNDFNTSVSIISGNMIIGETTAAPCDIQRA